MYLAIIAHVDHGKTTLVDQLLRQSGAAQLQSGERVMDSNDLEKERGITILSKCTGVSYNGYRINIVDTPGHADFGGEVERVLSMVDGVCLVVCGTEGPMTQTKFVLSKALQQGLKPIVVLNKVDRNTSRIDGVENDLLELFLELNADDRQLDYPIRYASAKNGWAIDSMGEKEVDFKPLFDAIIKNVPPPSVDREAPFSMLVTQIENDLFIGKCYMGKIASGKVKVGDAIKSLDINGVEVCNGRVTKILIRRGLEQVPVEEAGAGEIVSIAGLDGAFVNHTICDMENTSVLEHIPIDPPTISMMFYVNDSPLAGQDGKLLTSQVIRQRLLKEIETNVALQVDFVGDAFEVKGRGELQLGILIETMRREGFEISVSPPRVIYKTEITADNTKKILEPIEEVVIEVDQEFAGKVIERMTKGKGEMLSYDGDDKARLVFRIPTRGFLGYPAEFKNDTRGQGVLNNIFVGFEEHKGPIERVRKGSLVSTAQGEATPYAIEDIQARGKLFISPGTKVYEGMIIGESSREQDLDVNPVKAKATTNIRVAFKEQATALIPPVNMNLERMLNYIQGDEVIEVTPSAIRIRKKILDTDKRRSEKRKAKD
ncbi:hypothetical protein HK098_002883 [Nowakowskiella sp. JEL0407]|nr:hypothetical protein HK098_002883 [Nowakowskiella sp. JEL0407]